MGKLLGILVLLVLVAGGAYYYMNAGSDAGSADSGGKEKPRVEEKYGITSQTP